MIDYNLILYIGLGFMIRRFFIICSSSKYGNLFTIVNYID